MLGLDGGGDVSLPALELADRPVVIVVGSEGKGLSRLVTETCDQIVSIPIDGGHRVAERRHRGIRRPVPGLDAAHPRGLTRAASPRGKQQGGVARVGRELTAFDAIRDVDECAVHGRLDAQTGALGGHRVH